MNYYDILQVKKDSNIKEIRSSYKKLALKWHPDRNSDNKEFSENKFKEISEAYQVLSNEEQRIKYDNFGTYNFDFSNPKELFRNFFQDIPIEYIELANTFIIEFINSPECKLTLNIFNNIPNKDKIIQVLEIFNSDIPNNETKQNIEKFINQLKNKPQKKKENNLNILELASGYAFNLLNKSMTVTKKNNNSNTNEDIFKGKKNDIEFHVKCSLEDIYNKIEKNINIVRVSKCNDSNSSNHIFGEKEYFQEEKRIAFPAHFRPVLTFKNEGNQLPGSDISGDIIINIYQKDHSQFKIINDYDLITKRYISIYEIYNGCIFVLDYFNNRKISIRTNKNIFKNTVQKIYGLGLPIPQTENYGNLYIKFIIQYPEISEKNNKLLYTLFPPLNAGCPDNLNIDSFEEYLLEDKDYDINSDTDSNDSSII